MSESLPTRQKRSYSLLTLAVVVCLSACSKPPATLDLRAGECGASDAAGNPITFAHTTLTSDVDANAAQLCAIAKGARGLFAQYSRRVFRTMCAQALPPLRSALHTDDFAAMAQMMKDMGAEQSGDPKARQLLHLAENCANPNNVEFDLNHLRIYSVGNMKAEAKVCFGYLLEVQDTQNDSRSYNLVGTGDCAGGDPAGTAIVEPGTGDDPPGNRMRNRWAYTGDLPEKWVFRGTELAFVTDKPVTNVNQTPEKDAAAQQASAPVPATNALSLTGSDATVTALPSAQGNHVNAAGDGSAESAEAGDQTVRDFYHALGHGDGAKANSFMSLEKRAAPSYQPDAIEAFYGHMAEPLSLVSVSAVGAGDYEVRYRYRKQSAVCNGHAIVTTQDSGGHTLIARIKPIGNC